MFDKLVFGTSIEAGLGGSAGACPFRCRTDEDKVRVLSDDFASDLKSGLFAVCCDKLDGPAHFGKREIQSRCMTRWQDKHEYPW